MFPKRPIRRSSLISPWGVGAIIPFPSGETLMIASLDNWFRGNPLQGIEIEDERLKKRLGVTKLIWPPEYTENNRQVIPAIRFPRWHYCHFCGYMSQTKSVYEARPRCIAYEWKKGRICKTPGNLLIPERFIVICSNGHIDDFPIAEWIHSYGNKKYNPDTCVIRRSTGGSSSSLAGVFYECSCGAKRSMAEAFNKNALAKIGYKCKCCMPWLGKLSNDKENPCVDGELRVALRGASNVWFANIFSSIYIPINKENDSEIERLAESYLNTIKAASFDSNQHEEVINILASTKGIDADLLKKKIIELQTGNNLSKNEEEIISEEQYRFAEYNVLKQDNNYPEECFCTKNKKITNYLEIIHKYFNSITLVSQLKETRVFTGFSRVIPKELSFKERDRLLFSNPQKRGWLPAIQNQGEGIFFEFNSDSINLWKKNNTWVKTRIQKLSENYKKSIFGRNVDGELKVEFVLIHTFAHLIINQLCFECGYGSSSLRERIYCEKTSDNLGMYGVLIYTAAGDSEGSLGGIVRQGKEGTIENVVKNAINNAAWCSSDPVCIQSSGQGPESCNLAACHNCALLPETSCENGNRLLDRGFLVGDLENRDKGFFSDLLSK
ncbi:DUF1998 domain-containing protein [Succinivibrio sp.]|uniref:DUF1998 domain-containing protein n=1 Tax=Succinivibrio sp. TaxID=2053619 RepID=UPI0025D5AB1D|nr:DUF1998 domain-containing protein [Succinivibrio sp.]MBQ9221171.1 DUF1998 domain-containing protein [Succinivibrio sp.]